MAGATETGDHWRARLVVLALGVVALVGILAGGCDTYSDQMRACGFLCGGRVRSFAVVFRDGDRVPVCVCASQADGGRP